jgi:hypothetical protein
MMNAILEHPTLTVQMRLAPAPKLLKPKRFATLEEAILHGRRMVLRHRLPVHIDPGTGRAMLLDPAKVLPQHVALLPGRDSFACERCPLCEGLGHLAENDPLHALMLFHEPAKEPVAFC